MVLIIFAFSVSESSVAIVALKTDYNALRCHSDKRQLSVTIQCAVAPCKQGATFRCHSMRRSAVQTRGNFPLPWSSLQARGNFLRIWSCAAQERVPCSLSSGRLQKQFWGVLLRVTNSLASCSIFSKTGPFLGPKKGKFSELIAWLAWFQIKNRTSMLI